MFVDSDKIGITFVKIFVIEITALLAIFILLIALKK